jgi:integrase
MTTAAPTTALATIQPAFTDPERLALAGFLAGYRGLTREAYALDLRQFTAWCRTRSMALFAVRRADIEGFARELEARGRARTTVTRRLCTIAGFYKYAVEEELLDHSPAAHVGRPRLDYESHATALDRNKMGALLVAAGLGAPLEHALISLLALNGLRVSEATGADIEQLGLERGHRTLTITARAARSSPSRSRPAPPGRSTWRRGNAATARSSSPRMGGGWTGTAPGGSSGRSRAGPGSPNLSDRTRSGTRSLPPPKRRGVASDATFRSRREDGTVRDPGPVRRSGERDDGANPQVRSVVT